MASHTLSISQGPSVQNWEDIREVFTQLYNGRTLKDVAQILQVTHDFKASERMYKKRIKDWGLDKNYKTREVSLARTTVKGQEARGKDSVVSAGRKVLDVPKMKSCSRNPHSLKQIQQRMASTASVTCSSTESSEPRNNQHTALATEMSQPQIWAESTLSHNPRTCTPFKSSATRSPSSFIAFRSRRTTTSSLISLGTPNAFKPAAGYYDSPTRRQNTSTAPVVSPPHELYSDSVDFFRQLSVLPHQPYRGLQLPELSIIQQIYTEIAAYFDMFFTSDIWKPYHAEQFHCSHTNIPKLSISASSLRILDANETSLELSNPGAIVSLFETSSMLFRRGQSCEAGRLLNQAFETLRQLVCEQHPQLISSLLLLISILDGDSLSDLADMLLHQLHDMSLLVHGAQHPITRISSLLALIHQDRQESTQEALRVVCARFEQEVGADNPQYLRASYNLCWSFVQQGQYDIAKVRLQTLLAAYERLAGIEHLFSRQALYALAQIYSAQGMLTAARETLEELLRRMSYQFDSEIPVGTMPIEALRMLAALHGRQSHPEKMKDILATALKNGLQLLGPEHPIVLLVKHDFEDIAELLKVHTG